MPLTCDKESNKERKYNKDIITETLEENANLLLDQNLIYDLLNDGSPLESNKVEREITEYVADPAHQHGDSILLTERLSGLNLRHSSGGLEVVERTGNNLPDQMKNLSPFCQVLILELNTERQKSKDMEADLHICKNSLVDARRELEMLRQRDDQKSKQIDDSNKNIKSITLKCKASAQCLSKELDISQQQNKDLYMKNKILGSEKKELKIMVENLKEKIETCKDVQRDATSANERYGDAVKENKRLNEDFQGIKEKSEFFEAGFFKQTEEINSLKATMSSLERNLEDVSIGNSCKEVEMQQLKERLSIVMEKALQSEDQKVQSVAQNTQLQNEMKCLQNDKVSLKKEMHDFYKSKLRAALTQSTEDMQSRINYLENELKEKGESETMKMANIRKLYEEKLKTKIDQYSSRIDTLSKKATLLQEQNADLRHQREAIVRALSIPGNAEIPVRLAEYVQESSPNRDINHYNEQLYSPSLKEYQLSVLDKVPSHPASPRSRNSNKESIRRANLEALKVPPLITSTSLSSIYASSSDECDRQKVSGQANHGSRRKPARVAIPGRKTDPRIYTASEILDSFDTAASSSNKDGRAGPLSLRSVEGEISKLEREISILSATDSSIGVPFKQPLSHTDFRQNFNR